MPPRVVLLNVFDDMFLGLRSIGAYLKKNGVSVSYVTFRMPADYVPWGSADNELFDEEFQEPLSMRRSELDLLAELLEELRPVAVGLTTVSDYYCHNRAVTRMIRERLKIPVVWGGPDAYLSPDMAIREADIVCTGEGEQAMLEIVQALQSGSGLDAIAGIWWKDKSGDIRKNPPRPPLRDLDSLPFPDWSLEDYYVISQGERTRGAWRPSSYMADGRRIYALSGRGCPNHCSYCVHGRATGLEGAERPRIRRRGVDHFIGELRLLKKRFPKLDLMFFWDEVFTYSLPWIREFAQKYEKHIRLPFVCYTFPKNINRQVIQTLAGVGLQTASVGIQTGSERVNREVFHRPCSYQDVLDALGVLRDCGLDYAYELIGWNPDETEEDCLETVRLLREAPRPSTLIGVYRLHYYRNYSLTNDVLARGVPLRWLNPTTAVAQAGSEYDFWAALYFLLGTQQVSDQALKSLLGQPQLRQNPSGLLEIAENAWQAQFHPEHLYSRRKKDSYIRKLEAELARYQGSRAVQLYFRGKEMLGGRLGKPAAG